MHESSPDKPVRVIVIDDSRLMRKLISTCLEETGTIRVVAQAADTVEARALIKEHDPDVVTLDVEMPGMNGLDFLEKIMELRPMPVVMVSTLTATGTDTTLKALRMGAVDAIPKPAGRVHLASFGRSLRSKVVQASAARVQTVSARLAPAPAPHPPRRFIPPRGFRMPSLIAIGASTGGVHAIETLLGGLPANTPPVVITQHMPPIFTRRFATRLDARLPHHVAEAEDGEILKDGQIRIAPGDRHLCVRYTGPSVRTVLDDSGPISGHKPSVDVLFNSVSSNLGRRALGVILTGMGRDGAAVLKAMRNAGAYCIGQDERSCVVYGMPRSAQDLGAIDEQVHLAGIAPRICEILNASTARQSA